MPSTKAKPSTIDEYLADVNAEQRRVLETLRQTIRAVAPEAEECISYGLAAFRLNGRPLVAFGAFANHCAFYPMSSATVGVFRKQLKDFETSKGTIRFASDKPLPMTLVKKLVKARMMDNGGEARRKTATNKAVKRPAKGASGEDVQSVLAALKRLSNARIRKEMAPRYGIVTSNALGVRMSDMQQVAKRLGCNHALAQALWETGNYEARIVAGFVADKERVTPALMDRWCRDFDNWGVCDTVCFKLFDRTPHAFGKVAQWANRREEFQKRAGFALLACLALHDKRADNNAFVRCLPLIETAATDERNFVKKGVSWALRAIGRRNSELNAAAVTVARRLAASTEVAARWVGNDALRELTGPAVTRRLASLRRAREKTSS
jgi:3-methyladenine DNA glycosylase AlkD/uncharacterized protein YdhG (YjbR/CyaY superfamily)